ncbi:MAG: hypothetical protein ABL921_01210 [Pirellula sp.]
MLPVTLSFCLCALALVSSKNNQIVEEHVDLIELNHFFDHKGCHVYDQVIFYERAADTGRFQVRAWCLVEDRDALNRRPVKNIETQMYQVDWYDNDQKLMRKLTSRLFRESWSQIDPERANKKVHDERSRILLVQNPKKLFADKLSRQAAADKQCTEPTNVNVAANSANPPPQAAQATPSNGAIARR